MYLNHQTLNQQNYDDQEELLLSQTQTKINTFNIVTSLLKYQQETKNCENQNRIRKQVPFNDLNQYSYIQFKEYSRDSDNTLNFTLRDEQIKLKNSLIEFQGPLDQMQIIDLKKTIKKWKLLNQNLELQNKRLKQRLQKYEGGSKLNASYSSLKNGIKQVFEDKKKKQVLFQKQQNLNISLYHKTSINLRQKLYFDQVVNIYKDTKTLQILLESIKLAQVFQNMKADIRFLEMNLIEIIQQRQNVIDVFQIMEAQYKDKYSKLQNEFIQYTRESTSLIKKLTENLYNNKQLNQNNKKYDTTILKTQKNNQNNILIDKQTYKKQSYCQSSTQIKFPIAITIQQIPIQELENIITNQFIKQQLNQMQISKQKQKNESDIFEKYNCLELKFENTIRQYAQILFYIKNLLEGTAASNKLKYKGTILNDCLNQIEQRIIKLKKQQQECISQKQQILQKQDQISYKNEDILAAFSQNISECYNEIKGYEVGIRQKIRQFGQENHLCFFINMIFHTFNQIASVNLMNLPQVSSNLEKQLLKEFQKIIFVNTNKIRKWINSIIMQSELKRQINQRILNQNEQYTKELINFIIKNIETKQTQ